MPVRMTDIAAHPPSMVGKIEMEIEGIPSEDSFDSELELTEVDFVEAPAKPHNFMQIGQILREKIPVPDWANEASREGHGLAVEPSTQTSDVAEPAPQQANNTQEAGLKILSQLDTAGEPYKLSSAAELVSSATPQVRNLASASAADTQIDPPRTPQVHMDHVGSKVDDRKESQVPVKDADIKTIASPSRTNEPSSATQPLQAPKPTTLPDRPQSFNFQTPTELSIIETDPGAGPIQKLRAHNPFQLTPSVISNGNVQTQAAEGKIISQISSAISNTSKDTVEIRLDPPELGRVTITIAQNESGLSASISSEKIEIADLLRRHSELLSRELTKSGFGNASLDFSHRDQQDQTSPEGGNPHFPSESGVEADVTSAIATILQSQSGTLDIRL